MPENLTNSPLHVLIFALSEKYSQPITEVLDKKQNISELTFVDTPYDLNTLSPNHWDIVILSVAGFESTDFALLDNQASLSIIILYEGNEEERAFSLTDHRIIDIIPVGAIHRLPIILEREHKLRQADRYSSQDVTDQQHYKDALQVSESRYRAIVEDQSELICRYTPDFRLTFVNSAYSQQYGKTAGEMIGTSLFDHIPEAEWDIARAHVQLLTRDNPITISEHRSVMPDGTLRWQQWVDRAFFGSDDSIIEYQGVGRDIHDAKETRDQLNFLHALILGTSTADDLDDALTQSMRLICEAQDWEYGEVWIPDHNQQTLTIGSPHFIHPTKTEQLNPFWQATKSYQFTYGSGVPGRVWSSQKPSWTDDLQQLSQSEFLRLEHARASGLRGIVTIPIIHDDQVLAVMVFMTFRKLHCDEILLQLLSTSVQQIAPIIRNQQIASQLIESEAQLQQAQQIAHLGSWTLDFQTNETTWSDEFFRICGLEPGSVQETVELGFSLIHPDDRERAGEAVINSQQTGKPYNY